MSAGTIKKWLPCELYDAAGIEQWLDDMAARGYALGEWPGLTFIGRVPFHPDPKAVHARYRLEPIRDLVGEPALRKRTALYREQGWSFVTKIGSLYAVFRCDDPSAPNLYTDPESLSLAMEKLMRRQWLAQGLGLLWLVFLFRDELRTLFTAPSVFLMDVILRADLLIPLYVLMAAFAVVILAGDVRRLVFLQRVRNHLSQGEWPRPGRRRFPEEVRFFGAVAFLAIVVLLVFGLEFSGVLDGRRLDGPESWDFPHVTLAEALPDGAELLGGV